MQRKFLATAIFASSALLPLSAQAGPGYSYVDLAYVSADVDGGPTLDGFGLDGSIGLSNEIHLIAAYQALSKNDWDYDLFLVGPGYNSSLNNALDFVARAGYARTEIGIERGGRNRSDTDSGWFGQAGLRGMVNDQLELNGFLTHVDTSGSTTSLDLGGVYFVTPAIGLTLDASFSDDANVYQGGIRFAF
jgi:hypothetical protein